MWYMVLLTSRRLTHSYEINNFWNYFIVTEQVAQFVVNGVLNVGSGLDLWRSIDFLCLHNITDSIPARPDRMYTFCSCLKVDIFIYNFV